MSIADLGIDLIMAYTYYSEERYYFFQLTVGMVALTFALQLLTVVIQNAHKKSFKVMLFEAAPVILGLKAAADAKRVASGKSAQKGELLDSMMEMTINKMAELFAESIPGVFIQLLAIFPPETSETLVASHGSALPYLR